MKDCLICSKPLLSDGLFAPKYFVTSDSQPANFSPAIEFCQFCLLLQKKCDSEYQIQTKKIYEEYDIFGSSGKNDQLIFFKDGSSKYRMDLIYEAISDHIQLEPFGKLAEVGCGYGNFLSIFTQRNEDWQCSGFDLSSKYEPHVNKIKNSKYYNSDFTDSSEQYDLIVGIHLLEHLYNPMEFLRECSSKLITNGKIILQFPNFQASHFDLTIADHVCHFQPQHVIKMAEKAGLKLEVCSDNVINKELFVVMSKSKNINSSIDIMPSIPPFETLNFLSKFENLAIHHR